MRAQNFPRGAGHAVPDLHQYRHGIRNIDRGLVEMARSYGLSGFALFINVLLPGALPSIMVGVRFALGLMWLTLIVAETISANSGIGYLAMNAREFLQTDVVVVAIILMPCWANLLTSAPSGWNAAGFAGTRPISLRRRKHEYRPTHSGDTAVT